MKKVEIVVQNPLDALNAQKGGAKRLELVSAISEGGLTPSYGMIKETIKKTNIDVAVMLRPTSKSFCYDKYNLDIMREDAKIMQQMGVKRIVLGILDKYNRVDLEAIDYVLDGIEIPITFHRAIDSSKGIIENVKTLNNCKKITHILTSGGQGKAPDNIEIIRQILPLSRKKIIIGSGLDINSVDLLKSQISSKYDYDIHFARYTQDHLGNVDRGKVRGIVERFEE